MLHHCLYPGTDLSVSHNRSRPLRRVLILVRLRALPAFHTPTLATYPYLKILILNLQTFTLLTQVAVFLWRRFLKDLLAGLLGMVASGCTFTSHLLFKLLGRLAVFDWSGAADST